MMETGILCPFCNARIDGLAAGAKTVCPRCDAVLPASIIAKLGGATVVPMQTVDKPSAPGKKKTALALLGIMALMAAVTVAFALWTQNFRRQNDLKKGFIAAAAVSEAPDEMSALGLVPARCNILAAANFADLRGNPVAKKAFLEQAPHSIAWLGDRLKDATGLVFDDLDQVALGVEMTDKLPKIFVIVQTRAAYDSQSVLKPFAAAKGQTKSSLRNRPLVRFQLPRLGDGIVWCISERHLAFLFRIEPGGPLDDLEAIPVRPRQKLEGSSEAVKALVRERIDKQSLIWLAADLAPAAALIDLLSVAGARIEPYRLLLDAKAIAVNVKTDRDVVVLGHILPASPKDAEPVAKSLRDLNWRGELSKKVETTPPDANAPPWVSLQLRYDPVNIRELLEEGPGS